MAAEDPTQTKTQIIDPEIAKLLGLEDDFDLDYDDYFSLLREKIAKAAFEKDSKLSEEDLAKLANERKRIRDLKDYTFTTPPKKTVNVDSFFGRKKEEENKPITDTSKLLAGSPGATKASQAEPKIDDVEEQKDNKVDKLYKFVNGDLLSIVKEIRSLTEDIVNIFKKQSQANKKSQERNRIQQNKEKKAGRESKLESKKQDSKGSKLLNKVTKPFTNIFDTIKNFIVMVLLGSAVQWLMAVIENPKILLQPIQDLLDGIVGVFNGILQFIDNKLIQPVRGFIDSINSAISGFIDMINGALRFIPGSPQLPNDPDKGVVPNIPAMPELQAPDIVGNREPEPQQSQAQPQTSPGPGVNVKFSGGSIKPIIAKNAGGSITRPSPVLIKNMGGSTTPLPRKTPTIGNDTVSNKGGVVNNDTVNTKISGLGPDQYLTALSLGEYVLKPGAVDWLGGEDYLDKVNYMFGGRSERRTANVGDISIEAMNTGGSVGGEGGQGNRGIKRRDDAHKHNESTSSSSNVETTETTKNTETQIGPEKSTVEQNLKINDPPSNSPNAQTQEGRKLIPNEYIRNTKNTTHVKIGDKDKKNYVIRYERIGNSNSKEATYTVKQINKLVQSSFLGLNDKFTGVNPQSPEGKAVINSMELKKWFSWDDTAGQVDVKNIKVETHKDADLWYWYTRSYKANYDYWKKLNVTESEARNNAAKAAAEFSMPGKDEEGEGTSFLPGADNPSAAPESLKNVAVDSDVSSSPPGESGYGVSWDVAVEGSGVQQRYLDALESGRYINGPNNSSSSSSSSPSSSSSSPMGGGSAINARNYSSSAVSVVKNNNSYAMGMGGGSPVTGGNNSSSVSNFVTGGNNSSSVSNSFTGGNSSSSSVSNFMNGGNKSSSVSNSVSNSFTGGNNSSSVSNFMNGGNKSSSVSNSVSNSFTGGNNSSSVSNSFTGGNNSSSVSNSFTGGNNSSSVSNFMTGGNKSSSVSNSFTGGNKSSSVSNFISNKSNQIGGGSSTLDPTKTAASMPHVFKAAQEARAKARAEGLSPEEVERRVIIASENAKKNGPSAASISPSFQSSQPKQTLLQSTFQNRRENRGSSYTPPSQPKITPTKTPTIPSAPQSKSSMTMMPVPGGGNQSKTLSSGMTKTGTTPLPNISSFDGNQQTIVTVAAIYNIWGM
jgi:hypothetical protein